MFFVLGYGALLASIFYTSSILAFIGLGLIFWGAILLYVQTSDLTLTAILDASLTPYADTLNQTLQALDCKGTPVYLPPKYFENPEDTKIFIPKQENSPLPTPGQIQQQKNGAVITDPAGLLLTPPGANLTKLFEKTLQTNFTTVNVQYLEQHLPKLLIEDLEVVTSLEIQIPTNPQQHNNPTPQTSNNTIRVKMTTSTLRNVFTQISPHPETAALGNPLTSAIACAISKASGKPTTIENQETTEGGKTLKIEYRLLAEESTQE
jgi:hypothetical protein